MIRSQARRARPSRALADVRRIGGVEDATRRLLQYVVVPLWVGALHQATAVWDVAYADGQRRVTPTEQHIHGLLEQVPAMATAFLVVLHWDQAKALVGIGDEQPEWRPEWKRHPLPASYRRGFLATVTALIALPYGEELWRCVRAARRADLSGGA